MPRPSCRFTNHKGAQSKRGKDDDKDAIGAPLPPPFPSPGSAQAFHGWHVHGRLHHLRISSLLLSIQFLRSAPVKERERAVSLPLAAHHTQRTNHHPTTGFSTHFFTPAVFFSLASRADPASYFLQPMDPFNSIHWPACQPAKSRCEMSVRAALRRLLRVLFFVSLLANDARHFNTTPGCLRELGPGVAAASPPRNAPHQLNLAAVS